MGSSWARTAYFWEPYTLTWATPLMVEMRRAIRVWAYSSTAESGSVGELRARYRTGWSAGLTLRNDGGVGMFFGSVRTAREMAACTSWAAASISRSRLNWRVILVVPTPLVEVMESTPAMVESWFSRGVATADAMVSGLAPGRLALTWMVGKSTLGRSFTGNSP